MIVFAYLIDYIYDVAEMFEMVYDTLAGGIGWDWVEQAIGTFGLGFLDSPEFYLIKRAHCFGYEEYVTVAAIVIDNFRPDWSIASYRCMYLLLLW